MEREIEELKSQLASYGVHPKVPDIKTETIKTEQNPGGLGQVPPMDTFMGSEEAVASLMDLASGQEGGSFMRSPNARLLMSRRLGDVTLGQDQVYELFQMYGSHTSHRRQADLSQLFLLLPPFPPNLRLRDIT